MTPSRAADVKSSTRGSWRAVVNRSMKDPLRKGYILKCVTTLLKYELKKFCSKSRTLLTGHRPQQLNFKWMSIVNAKMYMPAPLKIL